MQRQKFWHCLMFFFAPTDTTPDRNLAHAAPKVHRLGIQFRVKASVDTEGNERVQQPRSSQHHHPTHVALPHSL